MRTILLITLLIAINTSTATIDVEKLKEQVAIKLETLTDVASTKLQTLTEKTSKTLQQLAENASENLKDFANNIDYEKLKKLNILNIIAGAQDRIAHKPSHVEKLKYYLKRIKGLKDKEVEMALHGVYPWPVVRRRIEYIYE